MNKWKGRLIVRLDVQFQQADPQQNFLAWRDHVHGVFSGLETQPRFGCDRFSAHLVVDQAPGLRVADIDAAAQTVTRPEGLARRSNSDEVGLLIQLAGSAIVDHGGAQVALLSGDALLLDNTQHYELVMPAPFRQAVLLVKREFWNSRLAELKEHVGRPVPASGNGRLLLAFARSLVAESGQLGEVGMTQAAMPLMDLICGAYSDPALRESESKSVSALRRRILQDVRERLTSAELSPSVFARRHGISVRYLHRLFQMRGQSFMGFVGQERMALCQRLLAGSDGHALRVTDLAIACGYANDSTFRRAFRRHFGCSVADFAAISRRRATAC